MKRITGLILSAVAILAAFLCVGCKENPGDSGSAGGNVKEMTQEEIFAEWVKGRDYALKTVDEYSSKRTISEEVTKGTEKEYSYSTEEEGRSGEKYYYLFFTYDGKTSESDPKIVDKNFTFRLDDSNDLTYKTIQVRSSGTFGNSKVVGSKDVDSLCRKSPSRLVNYYNLGKGESYGEFCELLNKQYEQAKSEGEYSFKKNADGSYSFVMSVESSNEEYGIKVSTTTELIVEGGKLVKIVYDDRVERTDETGTVVTVTHDETTFDYGKFDNDNYKKIVEENK